MKASNECVLTEIACVPEAVQQPKSTWLRRLSSTVSGALLATVLLAGAQPYPAKGSFCIVPAENGNWFNSNPAAQNITRVNFRMDCQSRFVTTCSGNICSGYYETIPHYYLRVYGKCYPSDCDWGEIEGQALTGSLAGWYYFVYNQGFAKRYVYVRTYPQWPGWLRVWIYNDFTDPARADYTIDEWFRH